MLLEGQHLLLQVRDGFEAGVPLLLGRLQVLLQVVELPDFLGCFFHLGGALFILFVVLGP